MPDPGAHWNAGREASTLGAPPTPPEGSSGPVLATAGPVWTPYPRPPLSVVIPAEHAGPGAPIRELPCIGVVGPDLELRDYVYLEAQRVVSASGDLDLDLDFDPQPVLLSTGGTLLRTYLVLRVVGDARETYAGPAHDVAPCFRLALEADADGRTSTPGTEVIAWLVHHPHERGSRVEADFERDAAAATTATVAEPDGLAHPLDADEPQHSPAPFDPGSYADPSDPGSPTDPFDPDSYAGPFDPGSYPDPGPYDAPAAPETEPAPAEPATAPDSAPAAVLVDPGPLDMRMLSGRTVSASAVDVLPAARPSARRGLFGRRP